MQDCEARDNAERRERERRLNPDNPDSQGWTSLTDAIRWHKWNDHRNPVCHCGRCFSVYHGQYGVLISAGVELGVCANLMKVFADTYDYDICDSVIAYETKSAICITTREKSKLWRQQLNLST